MIKIDSLMNKINLLIHWCKAPKALEEIGSIERANTLDLFRVLLTKSHTEEISKWLFESWNLV